MSVTHALVTFVLIAGLLTITPGLDTALVLRTAAASGPRRAMAAGVGICLGCLAWGLVAALGIRAFLSASELAYTALRIIGGGYLAIVGGQLLWRGRGSLAKPQPDAALGESSYTAFARGLLTNLLNPKVGVFYVSFLPVFIPRGVNPGRFGFLLASIHALEGLLWFSLLVLLTQTVVTWLRRPPVATALDRLTGLVFLGAGAKLLLERRGSG